MRDLTCLVGPNNSGKSNLIDAFAFLRDMSLMGLRAALEARDPGRLRFYGSGGAESVHFAVDIYPNEAGLSHERSIRYELKLSSDSRRVELEKLALIVDGSEEPLFTSEARGGQWQVLVRDQSSRTGVGEFTSPLFDYYLSQLPEAQRIKLFFSSFQFYRFMPEHLKRQGQALRVERFDREGGNFSAYVHTIQASHKKSFARIEDELRKNLPDIEELGTHLTPEGTTQVMIKERWFDRSAYGSQLSDGLVGFLAHLVSLYGPDDPALVVFEEPENYIHPRLMERLVDMLKGAAKSKQVMISTHSVPLINQLSMEDLLLIERSKDGATTARRIEAKKELAEALQGWALGEAYVSGVLNAP